MVRQRRSRSLAERFERLYEVDESGCWLWRSKINQAGYGMIWGGIELGRELRAHRVAYELHVGPIPDGLTIDHLCRVRHCVNPDHLQAVTRGTNVLRGASGPAANARKTHCKRGHEFTPENTYVTKAGYRNCRACMAMWQRELRRGRSAG